MAPKASGIAAALTAGLVAAAPAAAQSDTPRDCGWNLQVGHEQLNIAWPDSGSRYWTDITPLPPGGHIELKGRFPHARYLSFNTYSARVASTDALSDLEIRPDPGSTNPFLPGADRTATKRDFTIRIVGAVVPEKREPNTLYAGTHDGSSNTPGVLLAGFVIRIYEPDKGLDDTGGAGLPKATLVEADGTRHEMPECPYPRPPYAGQHAIVEDTLPSPATPATGALGRAQPKWRLFMNASSMFTNFAADGDLTGDAVAAPLTAQLDSSLPGGGIGENRDNKYLYTTFAAEQGEVLVFRGRAPTTPPTFDGEPTMGTGELRYWSLCSYSEATSSHGCVHDDEIPLDDEGRYTIVVSAKHARPKTATLQCGVAWVPAPAPRALLFFRHLLADPAFPHAIQRTKPGAEQKTMGDYYPSPSYLPAAEDFDRSHSLETSCPPATR